MPELSARPRRRYFTGDARRPWRVCRSPRPASWVGDVGYCRCGGPLTATPTSHTGYRHQPARVVNNGRTTILTLSEVVPVPAAGRDDNTGGSPHRLAHSPTGAALAFAIADHMSPRFGDVDPAALGARALRAAFALDAIAKAERCPLCAPELDAVRRG